MVMRLAAGLAGGPAATRACGAVVGRNRFTIRRVDVPVLAPDAEPLRFLHVSDLHLTPGQRRKQQWVAGLAALDPDLVLVTGDNIAHPAAVPALAAAYAPLLRYTGEFVFGC